MSKRDVFYQLARDRILPSEGGYTPPSPKDPETLFGITHSVMENNIRQMDAQRLATLPPNLQRHFQRIRSAPDATRDEYVSDYMHYIAEGLVPYSKSTTTPPRSTHEPREGIGAALSYDIIAAQNVALTIYYEKYMQEPGFDKFPEPLCYYMADMGINAGPARARWNLVKALAPGESDILSPEQYAQFPALTSSEANNGAVFGTSKGKPYTSARQDGMLLDALRHATPQQLAQAEARFNVWRNTYYGELAKDSPQHAHYLDGWKNRTAEFSTAMQTLNTTPASIDDVLLHQASAPTSNYQPGPDQIAILYDTLQNGSPDRIGNILDAPEKLQHGLKVQYCKHPITGEAIAVEIPGHGVAIYQIDEQGRFKGDHPTHLPDGVEFTTGRFKMELGDRVVSEAVSPNTILWKDANGQEQQLTLSPERNLVVRYAAIEQNLFLDHVPMNHTISADGTRLEGKTDIMFTNSVYDRQSGAHYAIETPTTPSNQNVADRAATVRGA